jgi:hypothetical protein
MFIAYCRRLVLTGQLMTGDCLKYFSGRFCALRIYILKLALQA